MTDQSANGFPASSDSVSRAQIISEAFDRLEAELGAAADGESKAVGNARAVAKILRQETTALQQSRAELSALYHVLQELGSIIDLGELLGLILDRAIALARAERGMLVLCHGYDAGYDIALSQRMEASEVEPTSQLAISRKLIRHVLDTRLPLITTDAQHDQRFSGSNSIVAFQIRSVLAVPLISQQDLIGVIYVDTRMNVRSFERSDLNLLSAMARQAAVAIHMARLYQDLETKNREMTRALKNLAEAQEELIQAERLSAIGAVASTVIHDLKGPLTVIRGTAQLLGEANLGREQNAKLADLIIKSIDTLSGMTSEVLDFARGEQRLAMAPFSAASFLNDLHEFVAREFAAQNIDVRVHAEYDGTVMGDRQKLWRAVYNVIKNGAEAMPEGGRLDTTVRRKDDSVEFVISDTGCGIPPNIQDKVFEPFRSYGKSHGTGLGLPIVKSIVEAHGGNVAFQTEMGKGSTFIIRLPLERSSAS